MNSPEAMAKALAEIPAILSKAGFVDGDALDTDEERLGEDGRIAFWSMRAERLEQVRRETFIVYKYSGDEPALYGDDGTDRRVRVYIDLWTLRGLNEPTTKNALAKMAKALEARGWTLELTDAPFLDRSSLRTQLSYSAEKIYQ